jgi:hypothetical protein
MVIYGHALNFFDCSTAQDRNTFIKFRNFFMVRMINGGVQAGKKLRDVF